MNYPFFLGIIILLSFQSCNENNSENLIGDTDFTKIGISDPLRGTIVQSNKISDYFSDEYFVVPLKTTKEFLIGFIDKLEVTDEKIFILDESTNSIFIYDFKGNPIKKVNNVGQGPGEYYKIVDFCVNEDKKSLLILDNFTRKILIYDLEGNFLSEKKLKVFVEDIQYIGDDRYAFYNNYNPVDPSGYNLKIVDANFSIIVKKYFRHTDAYCKTLLGKRGYMWDSNGDINLITTYKHNVYNIKSDTVVKKYELDFGKKYQIPKNKVFDDSKEFGNYDFVHSLTNFYETSQYLSVIYSIKNSRELLYYSKKTKKVFYTSPTKGSKWEVEPNLKPIYFEGYPNGVYNDFFIAIVPTEKIRFYIDNSKIIFKNKENYDKFHQSKGLELLRNRDVMDNPVLFFYKLDF